MKKIASLMLALTLMSSPVMAGTLTPDDLAKLEGAVKEKMSASDAKLYERHLAVLQLFMKEPKTPEEAKAAHGDVVGLLMSNMLDLLANYPELDEIIHPKK